MLVRPYSRMGRCRLFVLEREREGSVCMFVLVGNFATSILGKGVGALALGVGRGRYGMENWSL